MFDTAETRVLAQPLARPIGLVRSWAASGRLLVFLIAAAKFLLQLSYSGRYGPFRDELYYLACGRHLAWGYVDQPPFIGFVAWLGQHLFGNALPGIRFFPALAGSIVILLTGEICRKMGGGRFAQCLSAMAVFLAPICLAMDSFLSMNAFEPVFWMLAAYLVIRMMERGSPRLWLLIGLVAGFGLLNKHSMLVFGFALIVGLLLTPERRLLASRWLWVGALVALLIFLPNLVWEARHGWTQIVVVENARQFKNAPIGVLRFLREQVLFLQPIELPVWLAGLAWLMFSASGRKFRFLGWAYLVVMVVFIALGGKSYYPIPAYPMLMAAGGILLERTMALKVARARDFVLAYAALMLVCGIATIPFGVPILPVKYYLPYSARFPMTRDVQTERDSGGPLPQLYADMIGWRAMTETVAAVYHSLPAAQRQDCAVMAGNYGEAAAIDYYGAAFGLPNAISPHNNYFLWGPRGYSGACVILFGDKAETIKNNFQDVERAATIVRPYSVPVEDNLPVYICRRPRVPLSKLWPSLQYYI